MTDTVTTLSAVEAHEMLRSPGTVNLFAAALRQRHATDRDSLLIKFLKELTRAQERNPDDWQDVAQTAVNFTMSHMDTLSAGGTFPHGGNLTNEDTLAMVNALVGNEEHKPSALRKSAAKYRKRGVLASVAAGFTLGSAVTSIVHNSGNAGDVQKTALRDGAPSPASQMNDSGQPTAGNGASDTSPEATANPAERKYLTGENLMTALATAIFTLIAISSFWAAQNDDDEARRAILSHSPRTGDKFSDAFREAEGMLRSVAEAHRAMTARTATAGSMSR